MKIPGLPLKLVMEAIQQATGELKKQRDSSELMIVKDKLKWIYELVFQWQNEKSWASWINVLQNPEQIERKMDLLLVSCFSHPT